MSEQHAHQPLALAKVSIHAFRSATRAPTCVTIAFCLVSGNNFNIMSALFVHQLPILPQKIDSREGLF